MQQVLDGEPSAGVMLLLLNEAKLVERAVRQGLGGVLRLVGAFAFQAQGTDPVKAERAVVKAFSEWLKARVSATTQSASDLSRPPLAIPDEVELVR